MKFRSIFSRLDSAGEGFWADFQQVCEGFGGRGGGVRWISERRVGVKGVDSTDGIEDGIARGGALAMSVVAVGAADTGGPKGRGFADVYQREKPPSVGEVGEFQGLTLRKPDKLFAKVAKVRRGEFVEGSFGNSASDEQGEGDVIGMALAIENKFLAVVIRRKVLCKDGFGNLAVGIEGGTGEYAHWFNSQNKIAAPTIKPKRRPAPPCCQVIDHSPCAQAQTAFGSLPVPSQ
jgi:hypothetical protein